MKKLTIAVIFLCAGSLAAAACGPRTSHEPPASGDVGATPKVKSGAEHATTSVASPVEPGRSPEIGAATEAAPTVAPSLPGLPALAAEGPFFVHAMVPPTHSDGGRPQGGEPGQDGLLAVRSGDGDLAAVWRLPASGRMRSVSEAISPDGRWLAFVSGDLPDAHLSLAITVPLELQIWNLSEGKAAFSATIVHPGIRGDLRMQAEGLASEEGAAESLAGSTWEDSEPDRRADGPGNPLHWYAEEVVSAFRAGIGTLRWSPDSGRLAFVGALDGPGANVYVLDTEGWSTLRVSAEPAHVFRLAWSPDGRWILHESARRMSRASGSVLGRDTTISDSRGLGSHRLWAGSGLGPWAAGWPDAWLGNATAIVHSEGHGCGICSVLRIDATAGTTRTLASAMEGQSLALEPTSHHAALSAVIYGRGSTLSVESEGVHLVALDGAGHEQVHDQRCEVERWGANRLPYIWLPSRLEADCSSVAFGPEGERQRIDNPESASRTSVSPGGRWRLLFGDAGWRLFDRDSALQGARVQAEGKSPDAQPWRPVEAVAWHPDDSRLYWLAQETLWTAELPAGEPRAIAPWRSPVLDLAWTEGTDR